CWGYEANCDTSSRFEPKWPTGCRNDIPAVVYNQGDFGYIRNRLNELDEIQICKQRDATNGSDVRRSSMNCTGFVEFCQAHHLYLDLRHAASRAWPRHPEDVLSTHEVGGNCDVNKDVLLRQNTPNLNGELRAWFSELRHFSDVGAQQCDLFVDKPVVFMKLDQGENMYHHFCDFFNLYISLHLNKSIDFHDDFLVVNWDWSTRKYIDYFDTSWQVFSKHEVVGIQDWFGKRVCVRSAMFSLLPRMVLGLFYNTPLQNHCSGSGMMKSFSDLFLHRMNITQNGPEPGRVRVTFLIRSKKPDYLGKVYRQIMNEAELIQVLKNIPDFDVKGGKYSQDKMSFKEQLTVTHNSDIFIGMHGAGLTHFLFLPPWAVAFELYNCEAKCFRDLARLRGVRHMTWSRGDKMTSHSAREREFDPENHRYWNFSFDPTEFRRLVMDARSYVLSQAGFSHDEF
uniref:EGF domain-specific O-linked N-acetylglucosamine transferase n=1 Tax=Ciona savignyi TaxID=51511 RepID=H2ZP93_CIOSA